MAITPEKKTPTVRRRTATKIVLKDAPAAVAGKTIAAPEGEFMKKLGRRKEAAAQVRVHLSGKGLITINNRAFKEYFPRYELQQVVLAPLVLSGRAETLDVSALVRGGGLRGQADAVRLGIARALVAMDEQLRTSLKKAGNLKRDPRVKERKKYGLKKARRAAQWAKR